MTNYPGPIRFRRNATTGVYPGNAELLPGQPFINTADLKLYFRNTAGVVKDIVAEHPDVKVAKASAATALSATETLATSKADASALTALQATVTALTTGAPGSLDTFLEAYNRFVTNEGVVATKADASALTAHVADTNNPHNVSKSQIGLGNVNNTSDADKPISTATQNALDLKLSISNFNTALNAGVVATPTRDDAPTNKAYVLAQIAAGASGSSSAFEAALAGKLNVVDFDTKLADAVVPTPTRDDAPVNKAYVVAQVAAASSGGQELTLTTHATAAVAANRLLWVDEDGKVGEVDTTYGYLSAPNYNDLTSGPNIHALTYSNQGGAPGDSNANYSYAASTYPMDFPCIAELTNGNIVMVCISGNSPNMYRPKFCIMNRITGATVVAWTTVSTFVGNYAHTCRVHALTTGGFVVAFGNPNDDGSIRAAIYDNAGAVVMADTNLFTHTNNYSQYEEYYSWAIQPLAGGKWAIVYNDGNTTTGAAKAMLRIYSNTGTIVSAAAQIGSVAGNYDQLGFGTALMANGDFVVTTWGTSGVSAARFTNTGTLVGSVQTPASQLANFSPGYSTMSPHAGICELDNGSVAVSFLGTSDNLGRIAIINAGFTSILATVVPGGSVTGWTTTANKILALCQISGGFMVASVGPYALSYNNDGSVRLGPSTAQNFGPNFTTYSGFRSIKRCSISNRSTMLSVYYDGSSTGYCYITRINTLTLVYDRNVSVANGGWNTSGGSAFILRPDDMPLLSFNVGSYRAYYNPMLGLRSLIGVSKASASAGASVVVGAQGNFTLTHTFTVTGGTGWGNRWDHRSKALPGSIGVVYGTKATLNGLF